MTAIHQKKSDDRPQWCKNMEAHLEKQLKNDPSLYKELAIDREHHERLVREGKPRFFLPYVPYSLQEKSKRTRASRVTAQKRTRKAVAK